MTTGPKVILGPRECGLSRVAGLGIPELQQRTAAQDGRLWALEIQNVEQRVRRVKHYELLELAAAPGVEVEALIPRR